MRLRCLAAAALLAAVVLPSCFDATGPAPLAGRFALNPHFASPHAGIVPINRFRLILRRLSNDSVALDTVVAIAPGDTAVDLSFTVPMFTSADQFVLFLRLITSEGDTAFTAGPVTVAPSTGGIPPQVPVDLDYIGPGSNAAGVRILTLDPMVFFGQSIPVVAEAFDSADNAIPGTPIGWSSLDPLKALVPNPAQGQVVGAAQRGTAPIVATLLTGPADTIGVLVQPLPVRVSIDSGNGQTAAVGAPLASPVVALVKAADSLGVAGVAVHFSIPAGAGVLTHDSAVTDQSGRANVGWTLGTTAGVYDLTASVAGIPDSVATATVTAQPTAASKLVFEVQPANSVAGAFLTPAVVVTALDDFDNVDPTFTGTVTIGIGAGPGTLFGTLSAAAEAGSVDFDDLMIATERTGYTLVATSGTLTPATSAVFDITTPTPANVFWVNAAGGNWNNPSNWIADPAGSPLSRVPAAGDSVFITLDGTYTVPLDVDAVVTTLVVGGGAATSTQTLAIGGPTLTLDSVGAVLGGTGVGTGVLALSGGSLVSDDTLAVLGVFNWTGGTLTGGGVIAVAGQMNLAGGTKTLTNFKAVNLAPAKWSAGNMNASSGGTFLNEAGASLSVTGNVAFADMAIGPAPAFTNNGTLDIQGATLTVTGPFTHGALAVLQGTGTLDISGAPPVVFVGNVNPGTSPGVLGVTGPLEQSSLSAVNLELNGTGPGVGHDQLNVNGPATLNGLLTVTTGFTPLIGSTFPVLTFVSRSGHFSNISGLDLWPLIGVGLALDTVWGAGGLELAADGQLLFAADSTPSSGMRTADGLFRVNSGLDFLVNVTPEGELIDTYPRWSPDRKRITYTANNLLHVSTADPDADLAVGGVAHLAKDTLSRRARYSPNGVHLAYECGGISLGFTDVCTIADVTGPITSLENIGLGTNKTFVTDAVSSSLSGSPAFAWNPLKPNQLAVVRDTVLRAALTSKIYLVDFDGANVIPLDTLPAGRRVVETMDWSPDGKLLAFAVRNDTTSAQEIWTLDPVTLKFDTVSAPKFPAQDFRPVFSPSGSEILFQRDLVTPCEIRYVITKATAIADTDIPSTIGCTNTGLTGHDWSPDGSRIALVDVNTGGSTVVFIVQRADAGAYPLGRRAVRRAVDARSINDKHPSWRP